MCKPTNEKKLTNQFGVTFKELKDFINSIDFIPDDAMVYIAGAAMSLEQSVEEIIADSDRITLYD